MGSLGVVLYMLLCGYLPFFHEERAITVRLVRAGKFEFDDEEWGHISKDAKDLIRKLLALDVNSRITGEEILNHKFITTHTSSEATDSTSKASKADRVQKNALNTAQALQKEKLDTLLANALYQVYLNRWVQRAKEETVE